jgi:hypothetical protein
LNTFIQAYRKQVPNDPASDEELVLDYGSKYPLDQFPLDFQQDFKKLSTARAVEQSSMGEEFVKGFKRDLTGLEATGAGLLSLASDVVGAPYAKDFWAEIHQRKTKQGQEEYPASVPTVEQATQSLRAAGQYVTGKAGGLIPSTAEAVAMAGVGSMVAPGPGTVAGAGAGIFEQGAARAALSHLLTRKLTSEVRGEIEDYVAGKVVEGGLSKAASAAMKEAAGVAVSIPNFAAMGAGATYGELSGREGVSDKAALEAAAIAGAGSSIGAIIPARILHTLFGEEVGAEVGRSYIDRFAKQVPKEVLATGGGMGAMEFFNILAEKHADPKKKDEPFTKEDLSRILNASVVGGGLGAGLGAAGALRGPAEPTPKPDETTQPPPPPWQPVQPGSVGPETPPPAGSEVAANYPVPPEAMDGLRQMAQREISGQTKPEDVEAFLSSNPGYRLTYNQIKAEVQNAKGKEQAPGGIPPVVGEPTVGPTEGQAEAGAAQRGGAGEEGQVSQAASPPESSVSVPLLMTREMEQALADLGYSKEQRDALRPEDAQALISAQTRAPTKEVTPPHAEETKAQEKGDEGRVLTPKPETPADETSKLANKQASKPAGDLSDTSWVETVPESYLSWVEPVAGKEEAKFFEKGGLKKRGNNETTNTKGVFQKPDGTFVVATIKKTKGINRVEQGPEGSGIEAKRYSELIDEGWKPIGYSRGEFSKRFYREYTPEQWVEVRKGLEAKRDAARSAVGPEPPTMTKGEADLEGVRPETKFTSEPKSVSEAADLIHDLVVEKSGGLPKAGKARDMLEEALVSDRALSEKGKLAAVLSRDPDTFFETLDRIANVYENAVATGETDSGRLRERIAGALEGGDQKTPAPQGSAPPAVSPDIRQSRPETPSRQPGNAELSKVGTHVLQRLSRAGIPIQVMQARFGEVLRGFTQAMGSYDRGTRAINWALSDLSAPTTQDIRILFEEVGHALFDRESPEARDAILKAISKLNERSPGEFEQVQRDIAHAYSEGIRPEVKQEELLMGWLTRKLQAEGFDPTASRGIAQAVFRMLKDLYLRATMWLQQTMLGPEYNNPDLALRYFQNRLEGFLAGNQEMTSWIDRLGGGTPSYDRQVAMHQPIAGPAEDAQIYNTVTERIDTELLVQTGTASALLNVSEDMRYSIPAPDAPAEPFEPKERKFNLEVSVTNKLAEIHQKWIEDARAKHPELTEKDLKKWFGLQDTDATRVALAEKASLAGADKFNGAQKIEDWSNPINKNEADVRAQAALEHEASKIGDAVAKDKDALPRLTVKVDQMADEGGALIKNFLDSDINKEMLNRDLRTFSAEQIRRLNRASYDLGGIEQQMADIEGLSQHGLLDEKSVNAIGKFLLSDQLNGNKLYDVLDFMANDHGINFQDRASIIRSYIRDRVQGVPGVSEGDPTLHLYNELAQDTPEAKALLSTVIYYGKRNQKFMAALEMRRMSKGEERMQLTDEIKNLWKETTQAIRSGITQVGQAATMQDRAKVAFRQHLRDYVRMKDAKEHGERRIALGEGAVPWYRKAMDEIAARIGDRVPFEFKDGATVDVPKSMDRASGFDQHTINLSTTQGGITPADQLKQWAEKQSQWLALRELDAANGDQTARGMEYQRIKKQRDQIIRNTFYNHVERNTDHFNTELVVSPVAKQIDALGLPFASRVATKIRQYVGFNVAMVKQATNAFGWKNSRLMNQTMAVMTRGGRKIRQQWFEDNVLDKAQHFMDELKPEEWLTAEQNSDLGYQKLQRFLMQDPVIKPLIQDRIGDFMGALRNQIYAAHESAQFFIAKLERAGMGVTDPLLKERERKHIETGIETTPRKINGTFKNVVNALRNAFWLGNGEDDKGAYGDFAKVAELMNGGKEAEAQALIAKYTGHKVYGDTVSKDFLYAFFHVPRESIFKQPVMGDGVTRLDAETAIMAKAYDDANGNLLQALKLSYEYHGGTGDIGQYVQENLLRLAKEAGHMDAVMRQVEPKGDQRLISIKGMIPNPFMDARKLGHWPVDYFTHHRFDRNDIARVSQGVSAVLAFGRNSQEFADDHAGLKTDVSSLHGKLRSVLIAADKATPSGKTSEINAHAAKALSSDPDPRLAQFKTGQERLKFLRRIDGRAALIDSSRDQIVTYFQKNHDPVAGLRWGVWAAQSIGRQLVNNPASALGRLIAIFDIPAQWGASRITFGLVGKTLYYTGKDLAGSLLQAIGAQGPRLSVYERLYNDLGYAATDTERRFGDIFATMTGESNRNALGFNPLRAVRLFGEIQSAPLRLGGLRRGYTPFQPGALYTGAFNSVNRAFTVAHWEKAHDLIGRGIKFKLANPGKGEINAEDLGITGLGDKEFFKRWKRDITNHGLIFEDIVKSAIDRKATVDNTALTPDALAQLYSIGLHEVQLESSIATTPIKALTSPVWRFITPLVGWHFRRTLQVAELRMNEHQKTTLNAVGLGALGLAATGLGGIGLSLVIDKFQEEALGKKRNLANVAFPPTTLNDWIGINERLARAGTLGFWGEFANTAVNVGTGQGDNRALAADERIVALQSFQAIMRSVSALVHQNWDPDYSHVVRPFIYAVGGNGLLQYQDIANKMFDLDNVESRVVKRINAENYLRVTGRDLGMSIRTGTGAFNTPTPITPWIARMEYAAYANDPDLFREAYRSAIEKAKEGGKSDPVDYVKKAFETRHPIRTVFATTPSEREYQQVLANMDERGQTDVTEAVRLFNHYGQAIGLTPFNGSAKKDRPLSADTIARARERALMGAF